MREALIAMRGALTKHPGVCYHDYGTVIMVRTQIQVTEEQASRLKSVAATKGISIAEFIRQSLDTALAREPMASRDDAYERAARASGRFRSGASDTSVRHDDHLAEAYTT
jgi:hypothetical protein